MNVNNLNCQLEEFAELRHNAFVSVLELGSEGKHVAGIYGVNVPREILWAMDIVPINVFGIDGSNIEAAEKIMSKKSCSLLKASYGYIITDKCPFSHFAHIMVGTDYCGKKESMIYKLKKIKGAKKIYIIREHKNAYTQVSEYKNFIHFLQREFDTEFDKNKLAAVIKKTNAVGLLIQGITDIYMRHPRIMNGYDLVSIIYGSQFIFDLDRRIERLSQLRETLNIMLPESDTTFKRVLMTGVPLAGFREEILKPLSSLNYAILTLSGCEGENYKVANEEGDLFYNLSQKYEAENFCEKLSHIVSKYHIDGVINIKIKGCSLQYEDCSHLEIPHLSVTVDYNCDNYDKVLVHIKSFINNIQ